MQLVAVSKILEGRIEPSAFFDEDAEAVRLKHLEEQREETEITEMALHNKPLPISAGIEVQEESTTTDKRQQVSLFNTCLLLVLPLDALPLQLCQ